MSTGKLINNPDECGYRQWDVFSERSRCSHPDKELKHCDQFDIFPSKCPLSNAVAIKQIYGMSTTIVMKRRNRNDCKYFRRNKVLNCTCHRIIKSDCVGVNCGHYAKKDH